MKTPLFQEKFLFDPMTYAVPQENSLLAIMDSPVKDVKTGTLIAHSGMVLELSTIQALVEEIKPFGNGVAMMFSAGGFVAA